MNCTLESETSACIPVCDCTELVRGNDQRLLERFMPLVHRESVALSLENVTRIDAAGVSALIKLYCAARESGNSFAVSNLTPQVAEVLALVGLAAVLESQNPARYSYFCTRLQETAA